MQSNLNNQSCFRNFSDFLSQETNAVHMTIGAGSYMEITIPWTVKPEGYATKISGQLLHVDASTSLQVTLLKTNKQTNKQID